MKRAWAAAVVTLALVWPAMGQIRGVPASVTSFGPGRGAAPGPPASVTSLGPNGYSSPCSGPLISSAMGCPPTQFLSGFPAGRHRGPSNLRHHGYRGAYPIYIPYAYPVVVAAEPEPQADEAVEPEPPAPTIFEHRAIPARVSAAPVAPPAQQEEADATPAASEATPEPSPAEAREQIPTVLVYRDGHQQEVKNYAIVGSTLYDLGGFVAHKIPLTELNLKATIKANDDRGVEFALPASMKVD